MFFTGKILSVRFLLTHPVHGSLTGLDLVQPEMDSSCPPPAAIREDFILSSYVDGDYKKNGGRGGSEIAICIVLVGPHQRTTI